MSDKDENSPSLMESLSGVRKFQSDKVDHIAHQKRPVSRVKSKLNPLLEESAKQRGVASETAWYSHQLSTKQRSILRKGQFQLDAEIDLHGLRQSAARQQLLKFLAEAQTHRCRYLLIIHGKGRRSEQDAVLKPLARDILQSHSEILGWCDATVRDGGSGASYVLLKTGNRHA